MPPSAKVLAVPLSPEAAERARAIAAEMAEVGPALPGSILARSMRCASPGCHCHADPPVLHGPYWFWTRKVAAKTVSRVLSPEQVEDYRSWSEADRRLRALLRELEQIAIAAVEADPRSPHRAPRAAGGGQPTCGERVSAGGLVCDQAHFHASGPQLRAKCEDLTHVMSQDIVDRRTYRG